MELVNDRLLVTGGVRFIGTYLAERLLADGNEVVLVDDFSNGRKSWILNGAELIEDDLTDPETIDATIDPEVHGVFHPAARKSVKDANPRQQFEANTAMMYNVFEAIDNAGVTTRYRIISITLHQSRDVDLGKRSHVSGFPVHHPYIIRT